METIFQEVLELVDVCIWEINADIDKCQRVKTEWVMRTLKPEAASSHTPAYHGYGSANSYVHVDITNYYTKKYYRKSHDY